MARHILNRKELRADYDAAERRTQDPEHDELDGQAVESDDETEVEADQGEASESKHDEAGEEAPKKRKPAAKGTNTRSRSRAAIVTRTKIVWGVFNNSNQRVATYEYPKRKEADEHAARMTAEKKLTFFVQPVKEPMEDKKD